MIFEYQCLRLFLVLVLLVLSNGFAFAENDLVPEDECVLELTLPIGSVSILAGKDYGTQTELTREIRLTGFSASPVRTLPLKIKYPSGKSKKYELFLRGGQIVRFSKSDPSENKLTISPLLSDGYSFIRAANISRGWIVVLECSCNSPFLIDVKTGRTLRVFGKPRRHAHLCYSPSFCSFNDSGTELLVINHDDFTLWDVANGRILIKRHLEGNYSELSSDNNKNKFVLGVSGKNAVLWDVKTGRKLRTFSHEKDLISASLSPDARRILTFQKQEKDEWKITLWDVSTRNILKVYYGNRSASFSPDSKKVMTRIDRTINIWNSTTGHAVHTFDAPEKITSSFFSPNERVFVTECELKNGKHVLSLWNVESGNKIDLLTFDDSLGDLSYEHKVIFSPDYSKVAVSLQNNIYLLSTTTGEQLHKWKKNVFDNSYVGTTFLYIDKRLVLFCDGTLLDIETGEMISPFKNTPSIRRKDIKIADGGDLALSWQHNKSSEIWNLLNSKRITNMPIRIKNYDEYQKIKNLKFIPNSHELVTLSGMNSLELWDIKKCRKLEVFQHPTKISSTTFSADGTAIVIEGKSEEHNSRNATMWRLNPKSKIRSVSLDNHLNHFVTGYNFNASDVAISSNAGKLAVISDDGYKTSSKINVWETKTGQLLQTFNQDDGFQSVAISPDGNTVVSSSIRRESKQNSKETLEIVLLDVATGEKRDSYLYEKTETIVHGICVVDFNANGRSILATIGGNAAALIDVETRKQQIFVSDSWPIQSCQLSPDESLLITTSRSYGIIQYWDVATASLLVTLHNTDNGFLATTPEGLFDGPVESRNKICYCIGNGLNVLPVDQFFDGFYYPGLLSAILNGKRPLPNVKIEPPPIITLLSPSTLSLTEEEQVTIESVIEDQGGGIHKPVVKLNGSEYLIDEIPVKENGNQLRWCFTIPLISGVKNIIEVHSAASNGAIASLPARIIIKCDKPKERPELYMVAVGISDYADGQRIDLKCARNDAEVLAKTFRERGEFFYGKGKVHVKTVVDSQATMAGIQQAIAEVAKAAKPRDVFILTLAGHGVTLGERYYFIPYDYKSDTNEWQDERVRRQGLPEDKLDDWIASVPATKRVLVYDTCQSGSALGRSTSYEKTLESLARRSGCHVIAAAASNEQAQELPDIGHGALTYALVAGLGASEQGLLKNRSAASKDGMIGVLNWFQFAAENVPAITKLSLGKEQYIEFKSKAADFPILPVKTKEQDQ